MADETHRSPAPPDDPQDETTRRAAGGDLPGTLPASIGPYRVLRKLGEGGVGVVYEAEQDRHAVVCRRRVLASVNK